MKPKWKKVVIFARGKVYQVYDKTAGIGGCGYHYGCFW